MLKSFLNNTNNYFVLRYYRYIIKMDLLLNWRLTMEIRVIKENNIEIAIVNSEDILPTDVQSALKN